MRGSGCPLFFVLKGRVKYFIRRLLGDKSSSDYFKTFHLVDRMPKPLASIIKVCCFVSSRHSLSREDWHIENDNLVEFRCRWCGSRVEVEMKDAPDYVKSFSGSGIS